MALAAVALLVAQIMGLHLHLHTESASAFHSVPSELHFGDAGIHDDEHQDPHSAAVAGHHAHGDVEIDAIGDALAKLTLKLPPLGVLILAAMLTLARVAHTLPRAVDCDPPVQRHPFSLHPPANGPPRLFSPAV